MTEYKNPTPVAVLLVPFVDELGTRLLLVKRNIEPKKGMFELEEETGLLIREEELQLWKSSITPNNQVLIFCITREFNKEDFHKLVINSEVSAFALSSYSGDTEQFAFPLHESMAKHFLSLCIMENMDL